MERGILDERNSGLAATRRGRFRGFSMAKGVKKRRRDKRKFNKRLLLALFPCMLPCFMYCVWGSMEVYTGNAANFRFSYGDISLAVWGMFAASFLALWLLTALLRGKVFDAALSLLTGLSVASYAQNLFLNLDLGLLEGEAIDWASYAAHGRLNLCIFLLIAAAVAAGLMLLRKRAARAARMLASGLLVVQAVTLVAVSAQYFASGINEDKKSAYILSGEKQYDVSAEGNVVVFVLDYFSNEYFEDAMKLYPDMLAQFTDFTYYNNCDPAYIGTFPSTVHMLTGFAYDNTLTIDKWFRKAWESDSARDFYQRLAANGYKAHFFDNTSSYFGIRYAAPYYENLVSMKDAGYTIRYDMLAQTMLRLSCYRYLPHMFKEEFYMNSGDFNTSVRAQSGASANSLNHYRYYRSLKDGGLTAVEGEGKYFTIQFLRGTHPPYHLDENIRPNYDATLEQTAAAYIKMCGEYIRQLKQLGLYDDATIIVTSDHGDKENCMQVVYLIKEPHAKRSRMATNAAPISHADFIGTVLRCIGEDSPYASSIYDFQAGDMRQRTVMRNYIDRSYPAVGKYQSTAKGTHTVMYAYTYTGDRKNLRIQVRRGPTQILPLAESFN